MDDIILLGAIAAGLGMYCLHLRSKYEFMMKMHQYIFAGIYEGEVVVKEIKDGKGNTVYLPVPKSSNNN